VGLEEKSGREQNKKRENFSVRQAAILGGGRRGEWIFSGIFDKMG